jgi:hypothetical protein
MYLKKFLKKEYKLNELSILNKRDDEILSEN